MRTESTQWGQIVRDRKILAESENDDRQSATRRSCPQLPLN